jgi:hypothetical protein
MPTVYVARSPALQEWSADVGLTEHVYKVGVGEGTAEDAVKALNEDKVAGVTDWQVIKSEDVPAADLATIFAKVSVKEKAVDPLFYPRLGGATGLFKVKIKNVQTRMLVQKMMEGGEEKITKKPKAPDIAEYLIRNALEP